MMKITLVLLIFFLFKSVVVLSQDFPPSELTSIQWILIQYGINIPQDTTSICNSPGGQVTCTAGTPRHVKTINLAPSSTVSLGLPPTITQFDFPEITDLTIKPYGYYGDSSKNILNFIKNGLPKLKTLTIRSDSSVATIPTNIFDGLPRLIKVEFESLTPQTISPFFTGSQSLEIMSISSTTLHSFVLDQNTSQYPKLSVLTFNQLRPTVELTWNLSNQSFPQLKEFTLTTIGLLSQKVNLYIGNIPQLKKIVVSSSLRPISVFVNATENISSLTLSGEETTISPSLNGFKNLTYLYYSLYPNTTLQLDEYPDSLNYLGLSQSQLTQFPNLPIKNLLEINIPNSALQGEIPWNQFQGANNFYLVVNGNPGLVTQVPLSFCNNRLNILGCTGITVLPECFLCYTKNTNLISTDIVPAAGFNCNITFNSKFIYTQLGQAFINGTNIGVGNVYSGPANRFHLGVVVPNKYLKLTDSLPQSGPPTDITLKIDTNYPEYDTVFTLLEVGILMTGVSIRQKPTGIIQFSGYVDSANNYLGHTVKLNDTIDCTLTAPILSKTILTCNTTYPFKKGDTVKYFISNSYVNVTKFVPIEELYPHSLAMMYLDQPVKVGSNYLFSGSFGTTSFNQVKVYINGNSSLCTVTNYLSTQIACAQTDIYSGGRTNFTITVDGFPATIIQEIVSQQMDCTDTNKCGTHGSCNENGNCVCDIGYYSENCTVGIEYDLNNRSLINIHGDFGPYGQLEVSITLNNTLNCSVTSKSQTEINCTLATEPSDGLASVQLTVDKSTNANRNNYIYFRPPQSPDSQSCPNNCFGHGRCMNGKCQCDIGYNPIDNCLTKESNHTNTPNTTSPTTSFNVDGIDFQFEMVAIHELDSDDNIIKEVLTNQWNSTIINDTQTQTTTVNYQLNNRMTTSQVIATISFSSQARDIQFGNQQLSITANSIKLSVNISDWTYDSFLSTLRVVFKTTINNDQSIEYDCQDVNIDTLTYDQLSNNIQYLRVVKDNIQFTGRFVDYVLSDGRPTFSKTSLINRTTNTGDDSQSIILIGISTPQCTQCILDPDFAPLLIDKSKSDECSDNNNNWRIIVGAVVGVVGAVAIITASVLLVKKKIKTKNYNRDMKAKLERFN
ncbi:hypothetical protein DFA_10463 [Cavenderia fasciculata]|uniref:EGF-like domain-containing protein n=1 Tax=Cavenderia fasciculata TaxID=261658 RepID=F4QAA2_CACFS|nr:uncharacterized protein DFA_10463 [Cavenderia fasciculata]EGG15621.1 hypothetical protein DFA_10463 [Cavenderia fasciculata]|eukprot:XP_004354363.1 hypothetical protein DFA_10463 [Cavenderia fasciculata]